MVWAPHVTVATVVEDQGRFLLVHEFSEGRMVYNQPAGHLEADESLTQAAVRETLEETGWEVRLTGLLNVALYRSPYNGETYHRTTFIAQPVRQQAEGPLDADITAAVWLSYEEIVARREDLRSPLVLNVIDAYRAGQRHDLTLLDELL